MNIDEGEEVAILRRSADGPEAYVDADELIAKLDAKHSKDIRWIDPLVDPATLPVSIKAMHAAAKIGREKRLVGFEYALPADRCAQISWIRVITPGGYHRIKIKILAEDVAIEYQVLRCLRALS